MSVKINISQYQYDQIMNNINEILQRNIVDNTSEFEFLGVVTNGLTPRIKVSLIEQFNVMFQNLIGADHPIIVKNIINNIMFSLDSSIYGLFQIRNKNTFSALEIKNYLYSILSWLLDVEHNPSLLGNYLTVYDD